jgi:competence protein ComEC
MKFWQQYPFIRLVAPLIAGIILAIKIKIPIGNISYVMAFLLLLFHGWLTFLLKRKLTFKLRWLSGIPINLFLLITGYQLVIINTARFDRNNISLFSGKNSDIIFRVIEPPVEKPNSFKIIGMPVYLKDSLDWKQTSGRVLLYFEKDSLVSKIHYGDEILLHTTLNPVNPPQNPGEFDYKNYLSNRGIYDQAFVKSGEWTTIASDKGSGLISISTRLRNHFLYILESCKVTGDEFAVVSALLLGCSDYLDAEQLREYSGSGVMHILSVSGLHVGIIYIFLNFLLSFMDKKRSLKVFKAALLILLIWFYALVTGLSPSVLRASAMFTAIIIGDVINRNAHIYNTLAASAFILLILNPYMITSVGFQLSYLAVIGIVWLYRPLNTLYLPKNRILRYIWQTTAVSIAATITTIPLTIFYFRQFPNLFILANLIAIPLSTLIIYTGITVLLTSSINFLASFLSIILVFLIKALNSCMSFIEGLPFAVTHGLYINKWQMVIVAVMIISICSFLMVKNNRYLLVSIVMTLILMISFMVRNISHLTQNRIMVYSIPKSTAIDFISGKQVVMVADSALLKDQNKFDFHVKNNRIISGLVSANKDPVFISDYRDNNLFIKNGFLQFGEKKLVMIGSDFFSADTDKGTKVDYLLLSHDPDISVHKIAEMFSFEMIIIDNSNSLWRTNKWIDECKTEGFSYYSTRERGALKIEL